jgi:DNA-binding NarL/FixJ family response regulator
MNNGITSVLICERDATASRRLAQRLEQFDSRLQVSAISSGHKGNEALADQLRAKSAEVIVMHLGSGSEGERESIFKTVRELKSLTGLRFVVLTDMAEPEMVLNFFRAGGGGILLRSEPLEHLCRCIEIVKNGQVWISNAQMEYIFEAAFAGIPLNRNSAGKNLLTEREQQISDLVTEGLSNDEIGQRFLMSPHTVRNYVFHMFSKVGVFSRTELLFARSSNSQAS